MTVSYSQHVSTTSFFLFIRLLIRWRGSVFKLIWRDLLLYLVLYASCSAVYRCALTDAQKRVFEKIAIECESFRNAAPISFVLGFYVSIVVSRWWEQYMLIPWPDDACILAASYIQGKDARSKALRRCFVRYINLAFVLTFSRISARVVRAFPTYDHLIKAEYLTQKEKVILEMVDELNRHHQIWDPMPLLWASLVVIKARKEGYVPDDHSQEALIHEITNLRYFCSRLQEYNTMSVPLVYTQVATMATYSYFMFSVLSRQFLDPEQGYKGHLVDLYVPVFTILQFIFYMGWLKVAESLLNPFGDDDDDFDTNEILQRHFEVSYLIVEDMHKMKPNLLQDLEDVQEPPKQHTNSNSNCPHSETFDSFQYPTNDDTLHSSKYQKAPSSFKTTTSTAEINHIEVPPTESSQESFCSIATAIPNTYRRQRSQSLTSSSECSYDSCLSLLKQATSNKHETSKSSNQYKRKDYIRAASFEKVDEEFLEMSDCLERI